MIAEKPTIANDQDVVRPATYSARKYLELAGATVAWLATPIAIGAAIPAAGAGAAAAGTGTITAGVAVPTAGAAVAAGGGITLASVGTALAVTASAIGLAQQTGLISKPVPAHQTLPAAETAPPVPPVEPTMQGNTVLIVGAAIALVLLALMVKD